MIKFDQLQRLNKLIRWAYLDFVLDSTDHLCPYDGLPLTIAHILSGACELTMAHEELLWLRILLNRYGNVNKFAFFKLSCLRSVICDLYLTPLNIKYWWPLFLAFAPHFSCNLLAACRSSFCRLIIKLVSSHVTFVTYSLISSPHCFLSHLPGVFLVYFSNYLFFDFFVSTI